MNKSEYIDKVETLLSDQSKFTELVDTDPLHHTLKVKDKINYFIRSLSKSKIINNSTKYQFLVCSSHPGIQEQFISTLG